MSCEPLIDVLTPVWNVPAEYLQQCSAGLAAQSEQRFWWRLVDDGSEPRITSDTLRGPPSHNDPPLLTYLHRIQHVGHLGKAYNECLRLGTAPFVALQDADDWSDPERLTKQLAWLEAHPDEVHVSCGLWSVNGDGSPRDHHLYPEVVTLAEQRESNQVCGAGSMLRRSALEAIGGFCERWPAMHDYPTWYRLLRAGHKLHHLREPLYYYRQWPGQWEKRDKSSIQAASAELQALMRRGEPV